MKITEIRPLVCHAYRSNWVFVKVMTDSGLHGVGEAILEYSEQAVVGSIMGMERKLIGEDPWRIEDIWHRIYRDAYFRRSREQPEAPLKV